MKNAVVVFKTGLKKTILCYNWVTDSDAKCYEFRLDRRGDCFCSIPMENVLYVYDVTP